MEKITFNVQKYKCLISSNSIFPNQLLYLAVLKGNTIVGLNILVNLFTKFYSFFSFNSGFSLQQR